MEKLWIYMDRATILLALISAVSAFFAWLKATQLIRSNREAIERRRALITIRLTTEYNGQQKCLDLPYKPRRDQLSRTELLGILGMYYGADRFDSNSLRCILEDGTLSRVIDGADLRSSNDEVLVIPVEVEFFRKLEIGIGVSTAHK